MLDVRRLRVLREVSLQGSFSGAADALSYSQSAVSQQIAALEREAGTRLVDRGARGVRLTHAGVVLVEHADAILARLQTARRDLDAIADLRGGHLRMATFPSAGGSLVPPAVVRFRSRHPGVELTVTPAEPDEAVTALRAGAVDVAISLEATFSPFEEPGIARTVLLEDPMRLALPKGHPLAARSRLSLVDLRDEAWIGGTASPTCPDARILVRVCSAAGFEPAVAFTSDDYAAIQGFVAAGVGVALVPELALVNVREDIAVRQISGLGARRVIAIALEGRRHGPAEAAMLAILEEVGRDWAAGRPELALAS